MTFSDKFIKLPCTLVNKRLAEHNVKDEHETFIKVDPLQISHYHPTGEADEDWDSQTMLHLKNGGTFTINLTVDEFEQKINNFR